MKRLFLFLFVFCSGIAFTQTFSTEFQEYRNKVKAEFNEYKNRKQTEFENYRKVRNEEFCCLFGNIVERLYVVFC